MTRRRRIPSLLLALLVAVATMAACGGGTTAEGVVVQVGASIPYSAAANEFDEGEMLVASLDVEVDDRVVEATVPEDDQAELTELFAAGELQGAQVVVEMTGDPEDESSGEDETWVFVEMASG
jgi:hypothetical protein